MFAPVWQTMPVISIEYHRALKRKQKYIYNDHYNDFIHGGNLTFINLFDTKF